MSEWSAAPIDLAPGNPYSLLLESPVIVAPGCALRDFQTDLPGVIVTRTATLHTRRGAPPRFAATPAGLIVSELPSIGLRSLLKEEGRRWERSPVPILVCLQGDAAECAEMAAALENVEGVAGLLLTPEADVAQVVSFTRRQTPRPLIALLSRDTNLQESALKTVAAGADAVVVAAPPRAAFGSLDPVEGYLLGPAVFPLMLQALLELRAVTEVPLVALGGIATEELARFALEAGATAIMVDAARWGDPEAPARLARGLRTAADK